MASRDRLSSISGPTRSADGGRKAGRVTAITRVRTGCFTCRKRKKKCDEQKPVCGNCQRTAVVCEGFPTPEQWEHRIATKRQQANVSAMDGVAISSSHPFDTQDKYSNGIQVVEFGNPAGEDDFSGLQPNYGFMTEPDLDEDLDYDFGQQFANETNGILGHSSDTDGYSTSLGLSRNMIVTANDVKDVPQDLECRGHLETEQSSIPLGLPFIINGVDTAIQRQLFCHFTGVMSSLLAITVKGSNPFNAMVIPLALRDKVVMDTILCLAGSHITKLQKGAFDRALLKEQSRLHESALQAQAQRFHILKSLPLFAAASNTVDDQDAIVAASMLLCLYEICEGTGDDQWRLHLSRAREAITALSQHGQSQANSNRRPSTGAAAQDPIITEINPFLLEFYLYHESLSKVTVPSPPASRPIRSASQVQDSYMVGVQDGLSEFITRISALRVRADTSPSRPDGAVVCEAVLIWQDLEKWKPQGVDSSERRLTMEFYQWALFIWLFSIVYPEDKANEKIQGAVRRIADAMCNIKSISEGVMSCLLFPLFVVGSAAIQASDREAISSQFARLRAWSSLGNIDLTYRIVQQMWKDHDCGMPNSWDWVKQLEMRRMSFLVT